MSPKTIIAIIGTIAAFFGALACVDTHAAIGSVDLAVMLFIAICGFSVGFAAVASQRPFQWNFIPLLLTPVLASSFSLTLISVTIKAFRADIPGSTVSRVGGADADAIIVDGKLWLIPHQHSRTAVVLDTTTGRWKVPGE